VYGLEHTETATSYNNVSLLYLKLKELRLAHEFAEKSYAIYLKVLGPKHSDTINAHKTLAAILKMEKDPEYAKANISDSRVCSTCNKV
jgi:hypothetical protein